MTKAKATTNADIDPRSIAADFFRRLGGMEGMTRWGKTHRSLAYQLISKLMAQPLVQNNVSVCVEHASEDARRKLEDAFMRIIEARKINGADPAVYVDGIRLIEHERAPAEPRPATRDPPPQAADPAPDSNSAELKSPKKGTVFSRGSVATTPGETTLAAGQNKISKYSTVPGLASGAALDENADDKLSTTERFLNWRGHGGPP